MILKEKLLGRPIRVAFFSYYLSKILPLFVDNDNTFLRNSLGVIVDIKKFQGDTYFLILHPNGIGWMIENRGNIHLNCMLDINDYSK